MSDLAYYLPRELSVDGVERFASTALTCSPWAETMQHGAPPSALLVRALERCAPRPEARLTRVVVEILGPVPVGDVEVRAWVERPGRRVELVMAELWAAGRDGTARAVARGTGWRMATADTGTVQRAADPALGPVSAGLATIPDSPFWRTGFVSSLQWRWLVPAGGDGGGQVWVRPTPVLVDGEALSPLQRLFAVADVANGVGARLDPADWTYLNTDVSVHIFRVPDGEWIGIAAETSTGPDGVGMCAGVLYDEAGAVGRIAQTLQVRRRE